MVQYTGRGLVVKRQSVLSKVQMLNLVLGVGVFSLLPNIPPTQRTSDPKEVISRGWCTNCQNLREQQIYTTPRIALAMFIMACGCGARIVGLELKDQTLKKTRTSLVAEV